MFVIPEPGTALLVGLGLIGLGVAGRRERQGAGSTGTRAAQRT
jgi:hypothetical protein